MSALTFEASAQIPAKVESFRVNDVKLTQSAFKQAEDMDIRYLLGIDPDRLMAPYLKEAGLTPKAPNYPNWENTGLDGHIGGHYVSALSYMYASTGNKEIKDRLDYCISELKRCAEANGNGYLSGVVDGKKKWKEISEGNIRESSFGLNDGWVPLYNIHKIYAGLRDAYLLAGSKEAKQMFIALTDWMYELTKDLSDDQLQRMLNSEHGGLNETFADAAAISGDERFMELAKRFSHMKILEPLLRGEDRLTGMHANTQIPKVIGYKRIADIEGNTEWDKAAQFFWSTVVENRSITIGGNSVREHFHPADDFSSMLTSEQGPETCNTYNMLRLTKMLFATSADSRYMDYYERALYNHILSTINPVQGGFVYFTPMRSGHYRVYSQPQTSFWCCVGSGMENHARYGEMIYSHEGDDALYVNLFIPSTLQWGKVQVEQVSNFPAEEGIALVVNPKKAKEFTIKVRIPEWTDAANAIKYSKQISTEIDAYEYLSGNAQILVQKHVLHKILMLSLSLYYEAFEKKKVKVIVEDSNISIDLDYKSFNVILNNIFSNIQKYILPKSELRFAFKVIDNKVHMSITMYSLRIEDSERNKIFESGYSGLWASKIKLNGTGMGLYIVKMLLEQNKGSISIVSNHNESIEHDKIPYDNTTIEIVL